MASTEITTHQDSLNSQYLSSSFDNLSRSRSTNSLIVRTYKQATQLYLTKRFTEALEALEPIITPQHGQSGDHQHTNGDTNGHANGETNGHATNDGGPAPIAQSSRGTRTKVWVFYLSLLHAIVDIGQEEGKVTFGSTRWRQLAAKAREGTIWEEVVQHGYGGNEGEVDPDVVVNLATLLHGHMQDQRLNQQRLEMYLSTSENVGSNGHVDGTSTPMSSSSSSPKQLATRLKILELYTLHVLPANGEWDYAKQFIEMNDMLDEERKEAFSIALQQLKEEKDGTAQRERELKEQREREMEEQRQQQAEEARRSEDARKEDDEKRRAAVEAEKQDKPAKAPNGAASTHSKPKPQLPANNKPKQRGKPPPPAPSSPPPPATFYRRASSLLTNFQRMFLQASKSMAGNSYMAVLRLLMFVLAFLLIVARRDLRIKIRRVMEGGWVKVKKTVGMGVKVSYI